MIVDKKAARAVLALVASGVTREVAQVIVTRLYDAGCLLDDNALAVINRARTYTKAAPEHRTSEMVADLATAVRDYDRADSLLGPLGGQAH